MTSYSDESNSAIAAKKAILDNYRAKHTFFSVMLQVHLNWLAIDARSFNGIRQQYVLSVQRVYIVRYSRSLQFANSQDFADP